MSQDEPSPLSSFFLDTDEGYRIYAEEWGSPEGVPLLTLHGGPGSSCKPKHRLRFDLNKFRLIMFDRRNCGRSTPSAVEDRASLYFNSPDFIVKDIDAVRRHLGFEKWHVCGASWGSFLALLYAVTYPQNVSSLTLQALFLSQKSDWLWMAEGARLLSPFAFAACKNIIHPKEDDALIDTIMRVILEDTPEKAIRATKAFLEMEQSLELLKSSDSIEPEKEKPANEILNTGLIHAHMIKNHSMREGWACDEAAVKALENIPTQIIHGNCDVSCLMKNIRDLKVAHPHMNLLIAPNAGHGVDLQGKAEEYFSSVLANV